MIIKVTFNDNDFTQILENFFSEQNLNSVMYYLKRFEKDDDIETLKNYRKYHKLILEYTNKISENTINDVEIAEFIKILKDSITDYISDKYKENLEYLSKSLNISIQKSLTDKWENGEVVYYFIRCDKYIVM